MSAVFPNRPVIRHIRVACPPGQPPSAGTVSSSRTRPSESHMPQAIGAAVKGADASARAKSTRALPSHGAGRRVYKHWGMTFQ